jgi:hypothetical protein
MELKHRIDDLCAKVIAAPDGSEAFANAMRELRNALADHSQHMRRQIADLRRNAIPHLDDARER